MPSSSNFGANTIGSCSRVGWLTQILTLCFSQNTQKMLAVRIALPGCRLTETSSFLSAQGSLSSDGGAFDMLISVFLQGALLRVLWNSLRCFEVAPTPPLHAPQVCGVFLNEKDFNLNALPSVSYLQNRSWPEDVTWDLQQESCVVTSVALCCDVCVHTTNFRCWWKMEELPTPPTHPNHLHTS